MVMDDAVAAAALGVTLIIVLMILRWKLRSSFKPRVDSTEVLLHPPSQLVHRLCPHNNVVQSFDVEQKDSLDNHLDILARKLAEKESRLRLSKSKIRQTQNEIQSLHAIDNNVRLRYREVMDALRSDLMSNERDCRKLQEQIEWVSHRRAELKEEASVAVAGLECGACDQTRRSHRRSIDVVPEGHTVLFGDERLVRRGHRLYGDAAAQLASNLAELQRGRTTERITEKPIIPLVSSPRHCKEPQLPNAAPMSSLIIKSSPPTMIDHKLASQQTYSSN